MVDYPISIEDVIGIRPAALWCVQYSDVPNKACGMCVYVRGRQRRGLEEGQERGMVSMF